MATSSDWQILGPDLNSVFSRCESPLESLAAGIVPAIVLRGVYTPDWCRGFVQRLIAEELLYDPRLPVPDKFRQEAIPEGYYREGRSGEASYAWQSRTATGRARIDIGTSLGYRGSDKEAFLTHSGQTRSLFKKLFAETENPIRELYRNLQELSINKRAVTAYEPDGRQYGPAILRAHYGGYSYKPHFDSVRLREKRSDYAVYAFEHQFAGVLVLQNAESHGKTAQCRLHQCLWTPAVDPYLKSGSFHEYANDTGVDSIEVCLEPGDLYFFNTRSIHEVPGVAGPLPRIVLATFIGYSDDREEIFVWS